MYVYNRLKKIRGRTARSSVTEAATTRRYQHSNFQKSIFGLKNKKKEMIMLFHSVFECVLFLCVLQPVILKELKQADGDFTEDQRIELNTVRHCYASDFI